MNLLEYNVKQLSDGLSNKEFSAVELVHEYIKAIKQGKHLNIYITETFELAINQALEADKRYIKGERFSNLDGIPIGIKDIFLVEGIRTTNGSKFLEDFIAPYSSSITKKLQDSGMVCLGKLNMDEFAMGSTNTTSYFGSVISPWCGDKKLNYSPGGSSGGSSAVVAAYLAPCSLGTDTGGSVRQPAALTGTVGMKPSYGLCSRYGIIAFASSLDQAGPLTRTIEDNAMLLQEMAFYDEKDQTQQEYITQNYQELIGKSIKGLRIGIPKEYYSEDLNPEILNVWEKAREILVREGAEIITVTLPHTKYALPVYYTIATVEASSNLARFDGIRFGYRAEADTLEDLYKNSRAEGWGAEVKKRVIIGTYNLLTENYHNFLQASKVRRLIAQDFIEVFKQVDMLLTPTTTSDAFALDNIPTDPMEIYFSDVFTVPVNLAGIPALSLPISLSKNKLPLGIQLIGNYFKESQLYQVGYLIEKAANFNIKSEFANKLILNK